MHPNLKYSNNEKLKMLLRMRTRNIEDIIREYNNLPISAKMLIGIMNFFTEL